MYSIFKLLLPQVNFIATQDLNLALGEMNEMTMLQGNVHYQRSPQCHAKGMTFP